MLRRIGRGRWESWARLDRGDHGLGAQRADPATVGSIELDDHLRWVPRHGEGFRLPIADIEVRTPMKWPHRPSKGVEVFHLDIGTVRIRPTASAPDTVTFATQAYMGESARAGRLLRELVARGAIYRPAR